MKKLTILSLLFCGMLSFVHGQFEFSNLYGGANVGYAAPAGDFKDVADGGLTYNLVVGYKIMENLGVGIEVGSAATLGIDPNGDSGILGAEIYGLSAYMLRADYRFLLGKFRPFAAVGLGLASTEEPKVIGSDGQEYGEKRFGLGTSLELGFNIYGVNLSYAYVLNGKTPKEPYFNTANADVWAAFHRIQLGYIYNF